MSPNFQTHLEWSFLLPISSLIALWLGSMFCIIQSFEICQDVLDGPEYSPTLVNVLCAL